MAAAARTIRSSTEIWLIGQTMSSLRNQQLSTNSEVLKLFFFHKREQGLSTRESATSVILATN